MGDFRGESVVWVKMSIQYGEALADGYGVADSFPKDFGYGEEEADMEDSPAPSDSKPRILLMGLRRSGKSSIQKVRVNKRLVRFIANSLTAKQL